MHSGTASCLVLKKIAMAVRRHFHEANIVVVRYVNGRITLGQDCCVRLHGPSYEFPVHNINFSQTHFSVGCDNKASLYFNA